MIEIELKFPLGPHDDACEHENRITTIWSRIVALAGAPAPIVRQVDRYFAHPCRNFAATDEAFRLRLDGDQLRATYKGPRLDTTTKTRAEIELPLMTVTETDATALLESHTQLWLAVGFRPVLDVGKYRTPWMLTRDGAQIHILLDEVDGLGTFVELETLAEEIDRLDRTEVLLQVASELGLTASERRSYLELLMALSKTV